ncbi:MAG: lipopolysaccharide heptosyltransferase II [Deltaproteobacteria bacterium]|nr:lipopolysaccharide heptosyltransferase II [Deltaproteobacteria bacterium]
MTYNLTAYQSIRHLMIRVPNWVGDAVMAIPAVRAVRENFPAAVITAVARPWVRAVFRPGELVDEVIDYDVIGRHRGLLGRLVLIKALRRQRFDLGVLLQNAFDAAFLAWGAGIPIRAGFKTDARGMLLTHGVPLPRAVKQGHQVDYFLYVIEALGLQVTDRRPSLTPAMADLAAGKTALAEMGWHDSDLLVGVSPGASFGPAKRWPADRFGELVRLIKHQLGAKVVLLGSPGEEATGDAIARKSGAVDFNLIGRTDLGVAMAVISQCAAFVANDSGLMHVAGALNVPVVGLFGSTNHLATAPKTDKLVLVRHALPCSPCKKETCRLNTYDCLNLIQPMEVLAAVDRALSGRYDI